INKIESLIEISRFVVLISSVVVFHNIIKKEKITFYAISALLTFILFAEVLYFIVNLYTSFTISGVANTKGIASNINIEAISVLLKIPFSIYVLLKTQKVTHKICSIIGIVLGSSILFVISSRASFLALIIVSIILIFTYLKEIKKLLVPFIAVLAGYIFTVLYINPTINSDGGRLNNLTIINESSLTRLAFYKEAFQSILEKPLLGVGVGNWKIFGIEAHKEIVTGYIVPYHAHNDFLQIGAEIGLFGLVAYIAVFVFAIWALYKYYKKGEQKIALTLLSFIVIYLVDAMLNFPISRPIIQMPLMFVLAIIISWDEEKQGSSLMSKYFAMALILLLIPSVISSAKVLDSFRKQDALLKDFGAQKFDTPLEYIESIDDNYPNLGATALPIKSIKANYYKDEAVVNRLLDIASLENPFIKYPQVLKSIRFRTDQNLDSSLYYAKEAFHGIPQNELHVINYLSILTILKDSLGADRVFERVKGMNSLNIWNAYMLTNITLERKLNPRLEKVLQESLKLFPKEERFKLYELRLTNGDSIIELANNTFMKATTLFEQNEFPKSAQLYLDASKLLPEDAAYLENAGHAYYMSNQNNKAMKLFDSVINHYSNGSGKAEYLKGLMLFETKGEVNYACDLFETAIRKGNSDAQKAKKILCK
ncbi:MAG: O-antigen ligase family protein, partial [Flavobacteriaceae bacterium]|nr:O-antigen ligase family protein [Flavobacteriaceae bacterium]